MIDDRQACPHMLRYRPPRIAVALLAAAAALHVLLAAAGKNATGHVAAGILLGALGFLIMLRAWWLFRRHRTAICPTARTTRLIRNDVYRLTRNPMYLGIVLMLGGVAVATGSIPFYVATLAFFLIVDRVFCRYEEQELEREFGAAFLCYREQTRRWL